MDQMEMCKSMMADMEKMMSKIREMMASMEKKPMPDHKGEMSMEDKMYGKKGM